MRVSDLLATKGRDVATISQERSVRDALQVLKERGIGALIVTGATPPLVGIFSERDVVRALASSGEAALQMKVAPRSCSVIAVRADAGHPLVLSSSRHVTQGMVDITDEAWLKGRLAATSKLVGNDPYELRIAGLTDGGKTWKPGAVTVSPDDTAAGVTVSSEISSGLLLVTLRSPHSREVKWAVQFDGQ